MWIVPTALLVLALGILLYRRARRQEYHVVMRMEVNGKVVARRCIGHVISEMPIEIQCDPQVPLELIPVGKEDVS